MPQPEPVSTAGGAAGRSGGDMGEAGVLIRVVAPHFVAGVIAEDGRVKRTAPVLAYMHGWDGARVAAYVKRKGWTWERLTA